MFKHITRINLKILQKRKAKAAKGTHNNCEVDNNGYYLFMRKRLNKIFGRCCSLYNIKMSHNNFTFYLIHLIGLRSKCESIKKYKKKDNDDDIDIKKRRKVGTCEEFHFMLLIYRVSKLYHYFKSHSIKCILNLTKLCISSSCSTKNPKNQIEKFVCNTFLSL